MSDLYELTEKNLTLFQNMNNTLNLPVMVIPLDILKWVINNGYWTFCNSKTWKVYIGECNFIKTCVLNIDMYIEYQKTTLIKIWLHTKM